MVAHHARARLAPTEDQVPLHFDRQRHALVGADTAVLQAMLKILQNMPWVIVTDKLRSYGVAQRRLLPGIEHRQSRYLNNWFLSGNCGYE